MSSTNSTQGDNRPGSTDSKDQTPGNSTEQQSIQPSIKRNVTIKASTLHHEAEELLLVHDSLSSLDEVQARLTYQPNENDVERATAIKTESWTDTDVREDKSKTNSLHSLEEPGGDQSNLKELNQNDIKEAYTIKTNSSTVINIAKGESNETQTGSKMIGSSENQVNILEEKDVVLKHYGDTVKNNNNVCNSKPQGNVETSINLTIPSTSSKFENSNSINSIDELFFREKTKLEDEDSFITVEGFQKEKMTCTDEPTRFSPDNRTQNIIVARSGYANQPPPPYEYHENAGYQGQYMQTPAYETRYVNYQPDVPRDASRAPPYSINIMIADLFDTKEIRNKFVRKVYMILATQLLFTFGFIAFCIYEENTRTFVTRMWPLMIASTIAFCILLIALYCYQSARRTFPLNFILLSLLTLTMAYMTASLSCFYSTYIVMASMGVTAGICTLISLIACQKWFDVTQCGVALCLASIVVMIYGVIAIIITMITGSNIAYLIYSCLITLLFCMYLMYDTQQILGGKRIELSPEEYILGAITLYVDIMIIFQQILFLGALCDR